MKEGERGRSREAVPSAGLGEGPRSGSSLPSSFKCPRQSAARPLFARGPRGGGRPPLSSCRVCRRATASSLEVPSGAVCFRLGWDCRGREGEGGGGRGTAGRTGPAWATWKGDGTQGGRSDAQKCGKVRRRGRGPGRAGRAASAGRAGAAPHTLPDEGQPSSLTRIRRRQSSSKTDQKGPATPTVPCPRPPRSGDGGTARRLGAGGARRPSGPRGPCPCLALGLGVRVPPLLSLGLLLSSSPSLPPLLFLPSPSLPTPSQPVPPLLSSNLSPPPPTPPHATRLSAPWSLAHL